MGNINVGLILMFLFVVKNAEATSNYYDLFIYEVVLDKLCTSTTKLTANGTFPGPTIYANKGQNVFVNVHNNGTYGITLHWHGVIQPRNPWYDGTENVTQCRIPPGINFTYNLIFTKEEGTLWYHAHTDWSRATVHGSIIVHPHDGQYPFPIIPYAQETIFLASWYKEEVMKLYEAAREDNWYFPDADAFTINGQPGYPNNCSYETSYRMLVEQNKTYLVRVVNGVLSEEQFFSIAGHNMTLAGMDGGYTKPLTTNYIMITPGQTMDILVTTNQNPGCYFMASSPFFDSSITFANKTTTAILHYIGHCSNTTDPSSIPFPHLPQYNDSQAASNFTNNIRSISYQKSPVNVPRHINKHVLITIGVSNTTWDRKYASLNNVTFDFPKVDILQAYYRNMSGVYEDDFPSEPNPFNYTGDIGDISIVPINGTKVLMLNYSDAVEIVFQGTNVGPAENHPMHIHGFTIYVVASGSGNFNETTITTCSNNNSTNSTLPCYNLVDPPQVNTVPVPLDGWTAIRFVADNPGVWFVHCHLERHLTWGMNTVLIVKNGQKHEGMLPWPKYMPPCNCSTTSTKSLYSVVEEDAEEA